MSRPFLFTKNHTNFAEQTRPKHILPQLYKVNRIKLQFIILGSFLQLKKLRYKLTSTDAMSMEFLCNMKTNNCVLQFLWKECL